MSARIASGDEITRRLSEGPGPAVLLMTEPQAYADILRSAPARSVIALVVSDPRCLPANRELIALPAVKAAFRPHSLETLSTPAYVATVAAGLSDARPASASPRQVAYGIRTGIQTRARIRAVCRTVGNRYSPRPSATPTPSPRRSRRHSGRSPPTRASSTSPSGRRTARTVRWTSPSRGPRPVPATIRHPPRIEVAALGLPRTRATTTAGATGSTGRPTSRCSGAHGSRCARPVSWPTRASVCTKHSSAGRSPSSSRTAISQGTRPARHLADVVSGRSWSAALRKMQRTNELEQRGALGERAAVVPRRPPRDVRGHPGPAPTRGVTRATAPLVAPSRVSRRRREGAPSPGPRRASPTRRAPRRPPSR